MIDPISVITAAIVFGLGYLAGRRRRRRKNNEPVCGCRHHLSLHDPQTGHCHAGPGSPHYYSDGSGTFIAGKNAPPCVCRRYVGPEPVVEMWSPHPLMPTPVKDIREP